ncbi:MAG: helix-hairpin-helix domain-containing protein, partial [Bacteroidales bacterium]|nr:helix-hairpin-helix domain-containing protein [Bacteroidales bacterium]
MNSNVLLKYFLSIAFILNAFILSAQVENAVVLQDIVEEIAENSDEELDYTTLFNALENLAENPLDLNTASAEDFREVLFLSEYQIYSIIRYRTKYHGFQTIYELAFVEGLDELTMKYLYPFVTVSGEKPKEKTNWKKVFSYGKHTVLDRYQRVLQKKAGYNISDSILQINPDKSRYLGSPDKYYLKYNYAYKKKVSYGFTAEKDEGEQFFRGAQKYGFDFYSAHFQLNDVSIFKKIIVGDYVAQFGQGLTMWTGMSFGKGSGIDGMIKKPRMVDHYSSANESAFMRGEAAVIKLKDFTITEFVSYKSLDAGIAQADTLTEEEDLVTSFLETGYHRTPSEIAKRHTIKEFVTGGNVTWQGEKMKIGATGIYYSYSNPINTNDRSYEYFNFSGKSNFNFGVDYLFNLHKVNIFGETSISSNGGVATVDGATFDFVPEFKMSALYRYYSPKYQNMYAQGFSEGNKTYNESGLYIG